MYGSKFINDDSDIDPYGFCTYPTFKEGKANTTIADTVAEFLETTADLDGYTLDLVTKGYYKQTFGLTDPSLPDYSPLDIVTMSPKENVSEFSALYMRIERFILLDVNKYTGIPLDQFLTLPREIVELIFRIITFKAKGDYKTQKDTADKLKAEITGNT